jgi:hypothetical protein
MSICSLTHCKWHILNGLIIALQHWIFLEFQTRVHFCILQEEDDDGNTSPSHLSISATENARDHDSFNFDSGPDYQNKEMALSPTISRPHLKISRSVLFPSRVKMVHLHNLTLLDQLTKQCLILKSQRVFYFIIEMTYNERLSMLDCCLCWKKLLQITWNITQWGREIDLTIWQTTDKTLSANMLGKFTARYYLMNCVPRPKTNTCTT